MAQDRGLGGSLTNLTVNETGAMLLGVTPGGAASLTAPNLVINRGVMGMYSRFFNTSGFNDPVFLYFPSFQTNTGVIVFDRGTMTAGTSNTNGFVNDGYIYTARSFMNSVVGTMTNSALGSVSVNSSNHAIRFVNRVTNAGLIQVAAGGSINFLETLFENAGSTLTIGTGGTLSATNLR